MGTPGLASRRVLVVDDDPLVADSIRRMLQFDGHQVEVVFSAEDALGRFSTKTFDLTMVDYEMPKMKGDELARAIKAADPSQPIVMFTGYAEALSAEPTEAGGVDLILGKPFNLEQLRQTLARFPLRTNGAPGQPVSQG
ncbi:MAG TPA: response regulator [Verrucomicrobiae bacterium]|nr:response regulator [Verrucomicrobiae bacterium]